MYVLIQRKDWYNYNWNFLFVDGILYVYQRRAAEHWTYFLMEGIDLCLQITVMRDRRHQELQISFINDGLDEWQERYDCTIV